MNYWSAVGIINNEDGVEMTPRIIQAVEKALGYSREQLSSRNRKRPLVEARQIFCYLMRKHTKLSLEEISSYILRDHATVIHSCKVAGNLITYDTTFGIKYRSVVRAMHIGSPKKETPVTVARVLELNMQLPILS
jgi:chromosomal replication initiator protein